ncbi:cyclin-dependent kinase 12-like [Pseudorasbora parva]|uniref:cyclin-dependent kinase 12-like n=1 Tax=Pseudorasbora parva TaxID=51549 RepID=UPI00351EC19F
MPTIFETEQTSEYSDELTAALAAGRWWAIMEVSDPLPEYPEENGDLLSGKCSGTQRAPVPVRATQGGSVATRYIQGASKPARSTQRGSMPARSPQGGYVATRSTQGASVATRSTQGASAPASSEKEGLTSSPAFTGASEKVQYSGFSTADQRRKWTSKKPQGAPVPAGSRQEPQLPLRSQQRGKLGIPECLIKHLKEASLGSTKPAKPLQWAPVAFSSSPYRAPISEQIVERRPKPKIPEELRSELKEAPVPTRSNQGAPVPARSTQEAPFKTPMPNKPLRAPLAPMPGKFLDRPKQELLQQNPLAPSLKLEPVSCTSDINTSSECVQVTDPELRSKELLRQRLQNAPALVSASSLRIPRQLREKWRVMSEQDQKQKNNQNEVSVPAKAPQQPPGSLQGTPSCNTGAPATQQTLCVEFHNYQAPQIKKKRTLKKRTLSSTQPRTQLTLKRALDNAGVDQSPPPKKQRMATDLKDKQSNPGGTDQIDNLLASQNEGYPHLAQVRTLLFHVLAGDERDLQR